MSLRFRSFILFVCTLAALILLASGCCTKAPEEDSSENSTGVGDVVDYFTGKMPIDQGNRMKEQIRGIQRQHEEQFNELLDDEDK